MRYFAEFAITGERLYTYVADGMPYTAEDIMLKYPQVVEITEEEQALYLQGYIRGENGKPVLREVKTDAESNIEKVREAKVEEIQYLAKQKLVDTDHEIVEYLELHNLSDEEYEMLKSRRQSIRDLRDSLIDMVFQLDDIDAIEAVNFK